MTLLLIVFYEVKLFYWQACSQQADTLISLFAPRFYWIIINQ